MASVDTTATRSVQRSLAEQCGPPLRPQERRDKGKGKEKERLETVVNSLKGGPGPPTCPLPLHPLSALLRSLSFSDGRSRPYVQHSRRGGQLNLFSHPQRDSTICSQLLRSAQCQNVFLTNQWLPPFALDEYIMPCLGCTPRIRHRKSMNFVAHIFASCCVAGEKLDVTVPETHEDL